MDERAAADALAGAGRTLLLGPAIDDGSERRLCRLHGGESDGRLTVALDRSVDDVVARWRDADESPATLGVVTVDGSRGTTIPETGHVHTRAVSSPDDLTGLGIAVTETLDAMAAEQPVVCLDSLTVLLQYVDQEAAFRFLHVLTRYADSAGAAFHAHLDPATQDEETLSTLAALFDALARYEDGEWELRQR